MLARMLLLQLSATIRKSALSVPVRVLVTAPVAAPPVFRRVKVCGALAWPIKTIPKSVGLGVKTNAPGVMPVPVRATDGAPPSADETVSVAELACATVGRKAIPTEQLAPLASGAVQPLEVIANDAAPGPLSATVIAAVGEFPVLVTVTEALPDLVLTITFPKS